MKYSDRNLFRQFPPSPTCSCDICMFFCHRPGWWTVGQAEKVIQAGWARRMMLEISPDNAFGVLAPAFKGNEGYYALQVFRRKGCTFFHDRHCEIYNTGFLPLECAYCHHERKGLGPACHAALEKDWRTPWGQALVVRWSEIVDLGRMVEIVAT
jgi:hypothetical protein